MASLPDVPTIAETLPGFESAAWFAIVAPPKTPQATAAYMREEIERWHKVIKAANVKLD